MPAGDQILDEDHGYESITQYQMLYSVFFSKRFFLFPSARAAP
ncbi:hypothetical protein HMPREF0185_01961 [Brevundimonas diminuta 470-4]|nr:hypothetical protein HMPREF0185_01961 [Brevundimonas diminuta 470-4]